MVVTDSSILVYCCNSFLEKVDWTLSLSHEHKFSHETVADSFYDLKVDIMYL